MLTYTNFNGIIKSICYYLVKTYNHFGGKMNLFNRDDNPLGFNRDIQNERKKCRNLELKKKNKENKIVNYFYKNVSFGFILEIENKICCTQGSEAHKRIIQDIKQKYNENELTYHDIDALEKITVIYGDKETFSDSDKGDEEHVG